MRTTTLRACVALFAVAIFQAQAAFAAPILQWAFAGDDGTAVGAIGSTITDTSGVGNTGYLFYGTDVTYSTDIPAADRRQFTSGTSSLNFVSGAIRTVNAPNTYAKADADGAALNFAAITAAGGLTAELWMKNVNQAEPELAFATIFSLSAGIGLNTMEDNAFYRFRNGFGPGVNDAINFNIDDQSAWHHLAVVLSDPTLAGNNMTTDVTLYLDGVQIGDVLNTTIQDLARGIVVANHPSASASIRSQVTGLIYEPRVSLGALSPSEFTVVPVPEPTSIFLLALGGLGLVAHGRRRR